MLFNGLFDTYKEISKKIRQNVQLDLTEFFDKRKNLTKYHIS